MKPILLASLRYRRAWFCLGLLMALCVVVMSLLPSHDIPALGVNDKIEHGVAYLGLGFWFGSLIGRRDSLFLLLALLALGGGIEIAQGLMGLGREADLMDLAADAVGSLLGLGLAATPLGRWVRFIEDLLPRRQR